MALVMRHALGGGVRPALYASLGICLGTLVWGAASALGVSIILTRSALAFAVLKYAGGAYLIYLGARAINEAIRSNPGGRPEDRPLQPPDGDRSQIRRRGRPSGRPVVTFAQGLFNNLLNPKAGVFYLTFLPQFVDPARNILSQSMILASLHVLMGIVWLTFYARFIDRMAATLLTARFKRRMEAATGTVLMALGIRLALARR